MSDPPGSFLPRAHGFALALARRGARLRLGQTAASLSFLSLLALVPVFTIAVSLLGALPMLARLRETLLKFLAANLFLPSFSETVVRYLNQFAAKAGELSLLGALMFFATAFSALLTIDTTLNRIWGAERPRPLARRLTVYWTFLTLGPLVVAASLAVNGLVASELFGGTALRQVERLWLSVLPWLLTLGALTLLYRLVPNAPVRWRDAFAGALAAVVVLELLERGLGLQVARLPTYTVVYGTFAALPLFLVWLFMLWMTVLAGALFAASLPNWGAGAGVLLRPTAGRRFELAAQVLDHLARAAREGTPSVAATQLRARFSGDHESAADTIRLLVSLGYASRFWRLGESGPVDAERAIWDEHWMLSPAAASMTLRPLFERLWEAPPESAAQGRRFDAALLDRPLAG
jgi:membrane protein